MQAAVQAMADCEIIPGESVKAVWSESDTSNQKELEPVLMGSLLKFEPPGRGKFYATVATSGEVVFGTGPGERTKLAISKSGGTMPIAKLNVYTYRFRSTAVRHKSASQIGVWFRSNFASLASRQRSWRPI